MATPLEINIALHYHCRVDDYGLGNGDNNFNAPAVQEALLSFAARGLLRCSERGARKYDPTEGLYCFVNALCAIPWPERIWAIPSTTRTETP